MLRDTVRSTTNFHFSYNRVITMRRLTQVRCLISAALLTTAPWIFAADLTVSAASSLTNAFQEIARTYEARYPDAKVSLNFGASGALLQQIAKGAPVDVFATADELTMNQAQLQGLVSQDERHDIARNALVIILPHQAKYSVKRINDLTQVAIRRVAISNAASVPAGRYAKQALEQADLWSSIGSKMITTQNVRQSLDYVSRGEVEAGFVYATDAALRKKEVDVACDVLLTTPIRYPAAAVASSHHRAESHRFIQYLLSPTAQSIFAKYGFLPPT